MGLLSAAQRSVRGCWRLGWRCPEIFSPRGECVGRALAQAVAGLPNCVGGKCRFTEGHVILRWNVITPARVR